MQETIAVAAMAEDDNDSAGLMSVNTLPGLLAWRIGQTPAAEAYRHFDRTSLTWKSYSWQAFGEEVRKWRKALARENFPKGECIAILMPNGIEHIAMDQAALARGLVPVPMHALDNPESISYILRDSGATLLLVNSAEQWRAIVKSGDPGLSLRRVVYAEAGTADFAADSRLIPLERWLEAASSAPVSERDVDVRPGDLAAIVYTSGPTGRP